MQMARLSAPRGDFSDLHGRFQHLSLSAHVPICHFNRAGKKLPLNCRPQVQAANPLPGPGLLGRPQVRTGAHATGLRRSGLNANTGRESEPPTQVTGFGGTAGEPVAAAPR